MAQTVSQDEQFTFTAGLNTEAGYFTFPKNTWKEGDNVFPDVSGEIMKRTALDLEQGYQLTSLDITDVNRNQWAFKTEKWIAAGGNGDLNFVICQAGPTILFYTDTPIFTSAARKDFTINLPDYAPLGTTEIPGSAPIKCTSANGDLIITSRDTDPIVVSYDAETDTISVFRVTISIRDFKGVEDGLAINQKPTTLSTEHRYNLLNQGWTDALITAYHAAKGVYPSNSQSWIYGKDTSDSFDSNILDKQDFGTSPAPKGRHILNAFYEDRTAASGVVGIGVVSENYRPSMCAFFAGRAWYAGVQSNRLGSKVYFSQVALDRDKYGKCYQDADPTSEILSDLVDSDGGVITIQDCGEIADIVSKDNGVLVLSTNGVWMIVGTSQNGFTATGYEVKKLSNLGCVSRGSVVEVNDGILYWGYSGICRIGTDQVGQPQVGSITELNIKTLYNRIPSLAKRYATAVYNSSDTSVYWLYNRALTNSIVEFPYQKTDALGLDIRLGAFFTLSFPEDKSLPVITDVFVTKETLEQDTTYTVVDNSGNVVVDAANNVVEAPYLVKYKSSREYKLLTVVPSGGTYEVSFSDFLNDYDAPAKFRDWYSFNNVGVPYNAFIVTGYSFAPNGPSKYKQALYITTFMKRTESGFDIDANPINESSCTLQAMWDFTDNSYPGKWTAGEQIYRHKRMFIPSTLQFDDGYPVVITKSKIRGRGRALQLRFTADPDKDMKLLGWSIPMYGGTNV